MALYEELQHIELNTHGLGSKLGEAAQKKFDVVLKTFHDEIFLPKVDIRD